MHLLRIKLWGTRGSLPRALGHQAAEVLIGQLIERGKELNIKTLDEFKAACQTGGKLHPITAGGHTTCAEIIHKNHSILCDMGTGITDAGVAAMAEGRKEFSILLTHMHWDHIMGLPFFVPIYTPRNKITIYHVHKNAPQYVQILFNGINFPVKWEDLAATIVFKQVKIYQSFDLGGAHVTPFALDHPGGSFGYRIEGDGKSVAIGVDGEYKRLTPDELGKDLAYYQNLDLLIFDAQYEMDELISRYDWGHCSPPIGVDLALREGIRNLVFTHHDPRGTEARSRAMFDSAVKHLQAQLPNHKKVWEKRKQPQGPVLFSAYDGMILDLDKL